MQDDEGILSASIFGQGVTGYQRSARTRLPCVSISKTRKRKINASNNWNSGRFERLRFLTALSGSRYLKPPALPEVADLLAPEVGLEPTTTRLTAACSTIELLWN